MVEKIRPGLYKIEVPLPDNPLKSLNSYILKSPARNLIIDTGMNRAECIEKMYAGLQELEVDLEKTDLFVTHLHADHLGLALELSRDGSRIYFNRPDAEELDVASYWEDTLAYAAMNGFPLAILRTAMEKHPGFIYGPAGIPHFDILQEGDRLDVGSYHFECVETPGHTRGHICLYEPQKKMLISGDHILKDITPNISLFNDDENPLENYLLSLDKVSALDVDVVLPGHRTIFTDCRARIEELKEHHQARAGEVLDILQEKDMDAFAVASKMTWDLTYDSWDLFPVMQKWFAIGEALAHLKYLNAKGLVKQKMRNGSITYTVKQIIK